MGINKDDLKRLYHAHYTSLYHYARSIIGSSADAHEIVDDVFLALWHRRDSVDESNNVYAYLRKSIRNRCINFIKKQKLDTIRLDAVDFMVSSQDRLDEHLHVAELRSFIYDIIDELPTQCKKVFIMSRKDNLPHKEIAERLGLSYKTVENQIAIALKKIRTKLADSAFDIKSIHKK